jgi:hypothetical protein
MAAAAANARAAAARAPVGGAVTGQPPEAVTNG